MRLSVRETCFSSAAAAAAAGLPTEPVWFEQRRQQQQRQRGRGRGRGRLTWGGGEAEERKDDKQTRERRNKTPGIIAAIIDNNNSGNNSDQRACWDIKSHFISPHVRRRKRAVTRTPSIASLLLLLHTGQPNLTRHLSTQLGQRLTLWCRGGSHISKLKMIGC